MGVKLGKSYRKMREKILSHVKQEPYFTEGNFVLYKG